MESITTNMKVRIFQGDSSITRSFKVRKLSDGTVVLDDGTRRIVQRPEFHPDRIQAHQDPPQGRRLTTVDSFRSIAQKFLTKSINVVGAQTLGWFASQLQTGALSHFTG